MLTNQPETLRSACLIVLNYNGLKHLHLCLSTVIDAADEYRQNTPVILVDNGSTDGSQDWVQKHFPDVSLVQSQKNEFLYSLNPVVAKRAEDIVILLNNDMRFDRKFVSSLMRHFDDPKVFACTARIFNWDGTRVTTGQRVGKIFRCWYYQDWRLDVQHVCATIDACGGAAAFQRDMFVKLGGFDRLYWPGYYEDTDLSYRAWKHGWKVIYEPAAIAYHRVGASFSESHTGAQREQLLARNHTLFIAKNIGDPLFLLGFLFLLPVRILRSLLMGQKELAIGYLKAIRLFPMALSRRWRISKAVQFSDIEVLRSILSVRCV